MDNPFNTVIHGELWEKNMMFSENTDRDVDNKNEDDAKIVVLDWKNAKIASATKDLAFFLLSSTSNSLRLVRSQTKKGQSKNFHLFCPKRNRLDVIYCSEKP